MIEKIPMTSVCASKLRSLEQSGMEVVGVILVKRKDANGTYQRATVDNFGRVQWWNVDGSGRMVALKEPITQKAEIVKRLRELSEEMIEIGTAMDYYGGLAEHAKHGAELVGAAHIARSWIPEIEE